MKLRLLVFIAMLLSTLQPGSYLFSQQTPTRPPVGNSIDIKKTWTCECPSTVQVGFKNQFAGWKEGFGGGVGMTVPFQGAFISGSESTITCIYRSKEDQMVFTLIQQPPAGYSCIVEKITNKDYHNRKIICKPKVNPTRPRNQTN